MPGINLNKYFSHFIFNSTLFTVLDLLLKNTMYSLNFTNVDYITSEKIQLNSLYFLNVAFL